jgi:hypothetical protein
MRLRLHGTAIECDRAVARLAEVFTVIAVSGAYPDRPPSLLVRVYVEIRL